MFLSTNRSITLPEYGPQRDPSSTTPTAGTDEELLLAEGGLFSTTSRRVPQTNETSEEVFLGAGTRLSCRRPSRNSSILPLHEHRPISNITSRSELASRPPSYQYLSQPTAGHGQTNYVALSRKTIPCQRFLLPPASASIKGSFLINPYLHIPAALLSPLPDGQTKPRKNLILEVENGGINVNIYLVGRPPDNGVYAGPQTSLYLQLHGEKGNTFSLVAKIHKPTPDRRPFHLTAIAIDGYLSLHLPNSFHGLIKVTIDAGDLDSHLSLSSQMAYKSTILSETGTMRSYFVGELGGWSENGQEWAGDSATAVVGAGTIRLQVLGETDWDSLKNVAWKFGM